MNTKLPFEGSEEQAQLYIQNAQLALQKAGKKKKSEKTVVFDRNVTPESWSSGF